MRHFTGFIAAAVAALLVAGPWAWGTPFRVEPHETEGGPSPHHFTHRAMGTEFTFLIYPRAGDVGYNDLAPIADEAFDVIDALEAQISSWVPGSNTSVVNREAALKPVAVQSDLASLLHFCFEVNKNTDGAFDITVGPLIDVWRAVPKAGERPSEDAVAEALACTGMEKVRFDADERTVRFAVAGMRLDFGGVGKGLALDKAAHVLQRYGVKSALLSGGDSSMYAIGSPPGKTHWRIGIHNPYNKETRLGRVMLKDESLSTSACFHVLDGSTDEQPCGIFDPRTGRAVTGMVSVTVVAPTGMETDALSTAFYVLGVDGIRDYCEAHPSVRAIAVEMPVDGVPKPMHINGSTEIDERGGHSQ